MTAAQISAVFADTADPDYQKLLQVLLAGKKYLDEGRRFDRPGIIPSPNYIREMKRYGILPEDQADDKPIDAYATDRRYWKSFWHRPPR